MLRRAMCGVLLLGVIGCTQGSFTDPTSTKQLSYSQDVESLIVKRCLACHQREDAKAELVLDVGTGYDQMVGRASIQVPNLKIVEPGSAEESYLWIKLIDEQTVGKGMPKTLFGSKLLPPRELDLIKTWIDTGATP